MVCGPNFLAVLILPGLLLALRKEGEEDEDEEKHWRKLLRESSNNIS